MVQGGKLLSLQQKLFYCHHQHLQVTFLPYLVSYQI